MIWQTLGNFYEQFCLHEYQAARIMKVELYEADVKRIVEKLRSLELFSKKLGRKQDCKQLMQCSYDPLHAIDMYAVKQWMANRLLIMKSQCFLH